MTFSISKYDITIDYNESCINNFIIENTVVYTEVLQDIYNQSKGENGQIVIASEDKIFSFSKVIDVVWNPLFLDCNNKKILTKLYSELTDIANEELICELGSINQSIVDYLDKLIKYVPYDMEYDLDIDNTSLLKLYNVLIASDTDSFLIKLMDYLRAMHQICHIEYFVFIDIKQYFTLDELRELYKFLVYENLKVINISNVQSKIIDGETYLIIDEDLCMIDISN